MNVGKFVIEQLSEGFFERFEDGTFQKMEPSRLQKHGEDPNLDKFTTTLGIDPLLICNNGVNTVVDPGLGWGLDHNSHYRNTSNVATNLDIFDLKTDEINCVILSHLHFDHVAGCTFINEQFKTKATFPNATYLIHKDEWDYALTQIDSSPKKSGADYFLDEMYKLVAEKRIEFIKDEIHSPQKGLTLIRTGGHTPGHMIVKLSDRKETAYFTGDLIPAEFHLNHYSTKWIDVAPLQAKKVKTLLLKQAFKEHAIMFFYHSLYKKSGKLSKDQHKNYVLLDS